MLGFSKCFGAQLCVSVAKKAKTIANGYFNKILINLVEMKYMYI